VSMVARFRPDPTFYPSPTMAMQAPAEQLAYVVLLDPTGQTRPDAMAVVDCDPASKHYGQLVGQLDMPNIGDELHHFGWNACSACLCPYAPHPHVERRYLVVPGINSSRIYILDTKGRPAQPEIVRTIEPEEVFRRTGYASPHTTVHCGPEGIYISALGAPDGGGPGGIFMLDHESFDILGRWEIDRGPQHLHYDFWWHLGHDTMITSEWGTPSMVRRGSTRRRCSPGATGTRCTCGTCGAASTCSGSSWAPSSRWCSSCGPAHNPTRPWGFVGVVVSLKDLSASIWLWFLEKGEWKIKKVIEIPAEPADPSVLPPLLKGFGAVPPLITDINLSLDDKTLYVSCWGTGEFLQYDVSDPHAPKKIGSVHLGGIVRKRGPPEPAGACRSAAGRRWSRCPATVGACTSPTRCMRRGTSSSIRAASTAGW
jgi:selenium-binding protein 1